MARFAGEHGFLEVEIAAGDRLKVEVEDTAGGDGRGIWAEVTLPPAVVRQLLEFLQEHTRSTGSSGKPRGAG